MATARSANRQPYWWKVIERQQASGPSILGFCSKEGLAPVSFLAGPPPRMQIDRVKNPISDGFPSL